MGSSSSRSETTNITEDYNFVNNDAAPGGGDGFNIQAARSDFGDINIERVDDDIALAALGANRDATLEAFETVYNVSEQSGDSFELMLQSVDGATQRALDGLENAQRVVAENLVSNRQSDVAQVLQNVGKYGAMVAGGWLFVRLITEAK